MLTWNAQLKCSCIAEHSQGKTPLQLVLLLIIVVVDVVAAVVVVVAVVVVLIVVVVVGAWTSQLISSEPRNNTYSNT